ncbi:enoyl-[acyl-carrier-protein] reductase FabV [Streptosporangium sp. NPDC051023]|uniref:enoyl-[acyl-carrier-protein] reductase FabV n=1 Tax=Streptosporangium sp. NPDC051023 TaxID=3155410 RepID=UPI003450FDE9
MNARLIRPRGRGFLLLDSHPAGCARTVTDMWDIAVPAPRGTPRRRQVALVIGSSAGYGMAAAVAGLRHHGIDGVGLCLEQPPTDRRTATAGWYRTIAAADLAHEAGGDFFFVNGDAFADATKERVLDLIRDRFGGVDYLVYSVAAPRRTDPLTGRTHQSVIQPIGQAFETKTLDFGGAEPALREIRIEPATEQEIIDTIKVMGGEDWALWVDALVGRALARPGFTTVALSYVGSHLTSPIYREGTIGAAKAHLEETALTLNDRLGAIGGRALTAVNGGAVTQASTAIPGISLYTCLLRGVLGEDMRSPLAQSIEMWDGLTGVQDLALDGEGRLRLDRWELDPLVQERVTGRWDALTRETVGDLAATGWFREETLRLYGFAVPGVDYTRPVETDLPWPVTERPRQESTMNDPSPTGE